MLNNLEGNSPFRRRPAPALLTPAEQWALNETLVKACLLVESGLGPSLLHELLTLGDTAMQLQTRCDPDVLSGSCELLTSIEPGYQRVPLPGLAGKVDHNYSLALPFWFLSGRPRQMQVRAIGLVFPVRSTSRYMVFENGHLTGERETWLTGTEQLSRIETNNQCKQWGVLVKPGRPLPLEAPVFAHG